MKILAIYEQIVESGVIIAFLFETFFFNTRSFDTPFYTEEIFIIFGVMTRSV